jgi:5-methylcytosine-specific restriction endonuclease McrA
MPRKKPTATQVYKQCLTIAKTIAKERDGYTCQRCGKAKSEGFKIDASHVIPNTPKDRALAVEPENIKALCAGCHKFFWHLSPVESGLWFVEKFPKRWERIKKLRKSQPNKKGIEFWKAKKKELIELKESEGKKP